MRNLDFLRGAGDGGESRARKRLRLACGAAFLLALALPIRAGAETKSVGWIATDSTAADADALAAAYIERGGSAGLGPILGPAFRRPGDGALYLAAAGKVLRVDGDAAAPASVMGWFTAGDADGWLEQVRGVPRPLPEPSKEPSPSVMARPAWLTHPDIAAAYSAGGEEAAMREWGLPASLPQRFGPFISQRFDRGVLQLWVDAVPGQPEPGAITSVLVGDLLAEAGLLPLPPRPALPATVQPGDVLMRANSLDMVAITYDMGSIDEGLPGVLEALSSRGLAATFFVTGDFTRRYPWALPRILALGHEVANHTVTHPDLTTLATWRAVAEVDSLDAWLAARGAPPPTWFRPPFGAYDRRIQSVLANRGYPLVMWRLDLADWRPEIGSSDVIQIARRIRAGDVVVTHGGLPKTAAAMPQVLDELAARGLRQVTLTRLYGGG